MTPSSQDLHHGNPWNSNSLCYGYSMPVER
jgi:hypothetical protein